MSALASNWTWSALAMLVVILFLVGALPVYTVRLLVKFYPPDDPRRAELVAEMHQAIAYRDRWLWLFETAAVASIEGVAARVNARRFRVHRTTRTLRLLGEYLGLLEDSGLDGARELAYETPNVGLDIIFLSSEEHRRQAQDEWLAWVASELRSWTQACSDCGEAPFPLPDGLQERWRAQDGSR